MNEIFLIILSISIGALAYLTKNDIVRILEFVNRLLEIAEKQDKQIKYLETEIDKLKTERQKND